MHLTSIRNRILQQQQQQHQKEYNQKKKQEQEQRMRCLMCNKLNNCLPPLGMCACGNVCIKDVSWRKDEKKCTSIRKLRFALVYLYGDAWLSCAIDARSLNMWMTLLATPHTHLSCVYVDRYPLLYAVNVCARLVAAYAAKRMNIKI